MLVGRGHELALLRATLDRVDAFYAIAVIGEAGLGKSALLTTTSGWARERGFQLVQARATDYQRDLAFGLFIEALDDSVGRLDRARLASLGARHTAELGAVFPSLADAASDEPLGHRTERHRFHFAVRALLAELAKAGPIVVALDDVHWADKASIELITHLLRRPAPGPVLLLVAYRPWPVSRLLSAAVDTAHRAEWADVLELTPLTVAEVAQMCQDHDPDVIAELHAQSGGNPFYVRQLARSYDPQALGAARPATRADALPTAVRAAIERELIGLSSAASKLLKAAAVAGDPFEVDFAGQIARLPATDALPAVDELVARDLVHATEQPRHFGFRHPLIRRAVYESAGNGWRLAAHRLAAEAMAAEGFPPASLATHVERSARVGDRSAIETLRTAGDATVRRAPATAAHWYRTALRLVGGIDALSVARLELRLALASALGVQGELRESRDQLAQALDDMPPSDYVLRTPLTAQMAQLDSFSGHPRQARALLLEALERTPETALQQRAELLLEVAACNWHSADWPAAIQAARQAVTTARTLGDHAVAGSAEAVLSLIDEKRGDLHAAEIHRVAAQSLLQQASNEQIEHRLDGLTYLAWSSSDLGHHAEAALFAERGLRLASGNERAYLLITLTTVLALARLRLGDIDRAEQHADDALEAVLLARGKPTWAAAVRAWVALELDDLTTALREGERALLEGQDDRAAERCWLLPPVLAEAYLASGAPERARDCLTAGPQLHEVPLVRRATWLRALVEAETALGRLAAARTLLTQLDQAAQSCLNGEVIAQASWAKAIFCLADLRPGDAINGALETAGMLDRLDLPIDACKARILAARATAAAGQHDTARDTLQAAHANALARGAVRVANIAAAEARQLAGAIGTTRRDRTAGDARLTAREREVVTLIAKGQSNRQIAQELYLSARTVEAHVSRILSKLRVHNRAAVAALSAHASQTLRTDACPTNTLTRHCVHCDGPIPDTARLDAQYCSKRCRQQAWRTETRTREPSPSAGSAPIRRDKSNP